MLLLEVVTHNTGVGVGILVGLSAAILTILTGVLFLWSKVVSNSEKQISLSERLTSHENSNKESFTRFSNDLQTHKEHNDTDFRSLEQNNKENFNKLDAKLDDIYQLLINKIIK